MNIVTGEARHGRCEEATALLQHLHLVAVYVQRRSGIGLGKVEVLIQRITRLVGERREQRLAVSTVTPGAKIRLAITRELCRVQDGGIRSRLRLLSFHVLASRAVTLFALDA